MRATVCKEYTFAAAHKLPRHEGKCKNDHGHTYKLCVYVLGEVVQTPTSDCGMVVDFYTLDDMAKPIIEQLDHKYLNGVLSFTPTCEQLAGMFIQALQLELRNRHLDKRCIIVKVRLWESPSTYAEVWNHDIAPMEAFV